MFLTAFGLSKDQLTILNIIQPQFQHLSDPHAASGQQFKNQPISDFDGSENDLVNGLCFDYYPSGYHPFPVELADHGRFTGIAYTGIYVIAEKIEKGWQVGIAHSFCVGFVAVGETVQKWKDTIRCNLFNLVITKILAESVNDGLIRS
jgi:hypothetical protein